MSEAFPSLAVVFTKALPRIRECDTPQHFSRRHRHPLQAHQYADSNDRFIAELGIRDHFLCSVGLVDSITPRPSILGADFGDSDAQWRAVSQAGLARSVLAQYRSLSQTYSRRIAVCS
jgi:hypothetical protein